MRYTQHLYRTLDDVHVGEKVFLIHRPNSAGAMLVSNGVVYYVNAAFVRIAWEGKNVPQLDIFYRR